MSEKIALMKQIGRMADDASPEGGASSAPDLADLLKACGRGDQAAFAQLYDATSSRVVGLAVRVVRDPAQAEEVAQEAFLEIWKTSGRFDPAKGSPLGWLLTIVHRKAVDRVRSAEASTRRDTTYHQRNQPVEHDSTAEAATASLEARRVRQALASLTAVQREALELAYFGGYTHTEVATMLELPVGTAKTRIRDGLIRLRDTMGVGDMSDIHALSGAYAVDALDDIERAQFERHLAECPACRSEVDSLRRPRRSWPRPPSPTPSARAARPGARRHRRASGRCRRPDATVTALEPRRRRRVVTVSRGRCGGRRDRDRRDRLAAGERRRPAPDPYSQVIEAKRRAGVHA